MQHKYISLFLFLILYCSNLYPDYPSTSLDSLTIVILGSSTAAGIGASSKAKSWTGLFTDFCYSNSQRISVVNLAVSGYTTYNVLPTGFKPPANRPYPDTEHNISKALQFYPKTIIVNLPTNDIALGYQPDEYLNNFQILDSIARDNKINIWFTTTQPRNLQPDSMRFKLIELKDSILARYKMRSIDFWNGVATPNGYIVDLFNQDGVHLNDFGHALLFSRVKERNILESSINTLIGGKKRSDREDDENFTMLTCFPNPFNSSTEIIYRLKKSGHTKLKIFDLLGREIMTLVNEQKEAGEYRMRLNLGDLGSGIYLYNLKTDDYSIYKKMSFIK